MTAYSVYDPETGLIGISNKVFEDADGRYGKLLAEREMTFIAHGGDTHASLDLHYVWKGSLCERERQRTRINRSEIRAGGIECVALRSMPSGAVLTILLGDIPIHRATIEAANMEFPTPVPGIYSIHVHRPPFRDFTAKVIAR